MTKDSQDFLDSLINEFEQYKNPSIGKQQKAYMKNNFEFLGLKAPVRKEILRPFFIKSFLPPKSDLDALVRKLWENPYREFQMAAQDLAYKYKNLIEEKDIELYEFMITTKSWWDSVDFIAVKLVGDYFKKYPNRIEYYIEKWINSGNMWLQRTAILFQLKYKTQLDPNLLEFIIQSQLDSKEFFINKAIGWVLREYSKTNPTWVLNYINNNDQYLSNLSKREALRLMKKS